MGALDCVTANKITPTESTEVFTVKMASSYTLSEAVSFFLIILFFFLFLK